MYGEYRKRKEKKRNKREGDEGGEDRVCASRGGRERERDRRDTGLCNPFLAAFTRAQRGDERAVNSPARTKAAANRLCPRGTPRCH